MIRPALVRLVVEVELARLEKPVVLAGLASREARAEELVLALAGEFDLLRAAARRPLALQEELRALEAARVVEQVVIERGTEEAVDAALQAHAALAFHLAEFAVVAQEFAEHAELAMPDLGLAARAHLEIAHALDLLRVDRGGIRLVLRQRARCYSQSDRERRQAKQHQALVRFLSDVRIFNDSRRTTHSA